MTATRESAASSRFLLILAFLAIYLIWGSTYLAIRYAVETIPPLMTAAARHLTAGSILFVWAWARGFRPEHKHWVGALKIGALYFLLGHGLLHWAEQHVASGLAALLVATEPMIIALLSVSSGKLRFTPMLVTGMLLGLTGVGVLMGGGAMSQSGELIGIVAVLLSAIAWSVGVHFSRSVGLPEDALAASAMTLLCGSALLWIASALTGESANAHPSAFSLRSVFGLAYLIVFGTIIAFTAYTWLLSKISATVVSTHTYVNPIVAVLLGWMLAGESLDARVALATVIILSSVLLVRQGTQAVARKEELAMSDD